MIAALVVVAVLYALLQLGRTIPPLPSRLAGYRIEYAVTTTAGNKQVRSTRHLSVRRPFESRDETFQVGSTVPTSGLILSRDRVISIHDGRYFDLGGRPLSVPFSDHQLINAIPHLMVAGFAERRGSASYAGRECTVYRLGAPVGDPLARPIQTEYADVCLDPDGLVLAEEWIYGGKPLRKTLAVTVDTTSPDERSFLPPASASVQKGALGDTVVMLPRDASPKIGAPYWSSRRPPWGFTLVARVRVIHVDPASGSISPASFVDTYSRAGHVITVEHAQAEPGQAIQFQTLEIGKVGRLNVVLNSQGLGLRYTRDGWHIRISGSLDVGQLLDFARTLDRST